MIEDAEGPLFKLFLAWALLVVCLVIHAAGLTTLARRMRVGEEMPEHPFWRQLWSLVTASSVMVFLHLVQILLWALLYLWQDCMPDLETAFYFSSVTYTTVGYGDIVLPEAWRNMAGPEALTGILMAGLSTGFFFMVLNRMFTVRRRARSREHP